MPWWKEPTKDQWLAWWAAWMGWTLDSFDFTVFLLIMVPISQGVQRSADRGDRGLRHHAVAAAGRRDRVRLARRSGRAEDPADDLDPLVLDLQLHRRLLAHLRLPVLLPRAARHRHGSGMAGRRIARHGILAGALARTDEFGAARLVGARLPAPPAPPTACCSTASAGAACCGSASCRRWSSSGCANTSRNREVWLENRRKQREQKQARFACRCSPSSSAAISPTR